MPQETWIGRSDPPCAQEFWDTFVSVWERLCRSPESWQAVSGEHWSGAARTRAMLGSGRDRQPMNPSANPAHPQNILGLVGKELGYRESVRAYEAYKTDFSLWGMAACDGRYDAYQGR